MNISRRTFFSKAGGMVAMLGLLSATRNAFADWNASAFGAKTVPAVLKDLGNLTLVDSPDILLMAPDIAEDGSVVPVEVTSSIPNTQRIDIIAEQNPNPLAASFRFSNGALPFIGTKIKMGKTANVRAIVIADGKAWTAAKMIKVTAGGCGG